VNLAQGIALRRTPGKSSERDLDGIIRLIDEQADSQFFVNQKRKT
jgi:hypothetical protein